MPGMTCVDADGGVLRDAEGRAAAGHDRRGLRARAAARDRRALRLRLRLRHAAPTTATSASCSSRRPTSCARSTASMADFTARLSAALNDATIALSSTRRLVARPSLTVAAVASWSRVALGGARRADAHLRQRADRDGLLAAGPAHRAAGTRAARRGCRAARHPRHLSRDRRRRCRSSACWSFRRSSIRRSDLWKRMPEHVRRPCSASLDPLPA